MGNRLDAAERVIRLRELIQAIIDELPDTGQWSACPLIHLPATERAVGGYLPEDTEYKVLEKNTEQLWAKLQFTKVSVLGVSVSDLKVQFMFADDETKPLTVSMMLDRGTGLEFLKNLLPIQLGQINYSIEVGDRWYPTVLSAVGEVKLKNEEWNVEIKYINGTGSFTVKISGGEKSRYSIKKLCELIGIEDFIQHLPSELLSVLSSVLLEEIEVTYNLEEKRLESYAVTIGVQAEWHVFQGFQIKNPTCHLRITYLRSEDSSTDARYQVSVQGSFIIEEKDIPVTLEYDEEGQVFAVLIEGEKPVALPDLSHLTSFIGDMKLSSILPEGYSSSKLFLRKLGFYYSCGGNSLSRFFFELGLDAGWKFFGNLCIQEMTLYYDRGSSEDCVMFGGKFSIKDTEFQVSVQKKGGKYFLSGEPIMPLSLSIEEICVFLGFEKIPAVYPISLSLLTIKLEWDIETDTVYTELQEGYGNVFLYRKKENKTTGYLFGIEWNDQIALQNLPFAGNYARLLNDPRIYKMYLVISSSETKPDIPYLPDLKGITIEEGVSFLAVLTADGEEKPCVFYFKPENGNNRLLTRETAGNSNVDIHKVAGPFILNRVSLSFADGVIWFLVDAGIQLNGFEFILEGLGAGYSLADKTVAFTLNGLLVDIHAETFSLGGSLLKKGENTYEGSLLLQVGPIMLTAFGGYTKKDFTSVYAWASLNGQIGGPPCFYVTGIAACFGYNRGVSIPPIEQLEDCPLIIGMSGDVQPEDIDNMFPIKRGENWFGAGVSFQSFNMIDSIAILIVKMGKDTEVDLVGRSSMTIPFGVDDHVSPIAKAVLLLRGSFRKSEGKIALEAALSSDSYILSRDCRISGQFAYYSWFTGDFVLTLGGYRNSYQKPEQYPDVPRLSLNWNLSDHLNMQGSMYFALTPSCLMAGGELNLLFHVSRVKAWFQASVDIYLSWQPYSYDIQTYIKIGVQVNLWLCKVRAEIGCGLHIWGPDFAGVARIELWCISFSIAFGDQGKAKKNYIDVPTFISSFLRKPQNEIENEKERMESASFQGSDISITGGLKSQEKKEEIWNVYGDTLMLQVKSSVPFCKLEGLKCASQESKNNFILRTCKNEQGDVVKIHPVLTIIIKREDGELTDNFIATPISEEVPAAIWAAEDYVGETITAWTGVKITIIPQGCSYKNYGTTVVREEPDIEILAKAVMPEHQDWEHKEYKWNQHLNDINAGRAMENRQNILKVLHMDDIPIVLDETEKEPESLFRDFIQIETTGLR